MCYQMIQTPEQLDAVCACLRQNETTLMLDTEFVRTRTFYANLGLLQIFDGHQCFLVDPLLCDLNNSDFWSLLTHHHWVLHAFGEDLEILKHHVSQFGLSIFDTQIGAAFLGHGISMGYQALIQETAGVLLDKGESRTDWLARPLTARQLDYAAKDVTYLYQAYHTLIDTLKTRHLYDFVLAESARLAKLRCQENDPQTAYLDIKNAWRLTRQELAVLQKLAAWRLETAIAKDMPVNNVVREEALWLMAKNQPDHKNMLKETGIAPQAFRIHGVALLRLIKEAKELESANWPEKIKRLIDFPHYKQTLQQIREAITLVEVQTTIPADVLAPKRLIHELLNWHWQLTDEQRADEQNKPTLLSGWRYSILEAYLPKIG
ncbi:ribonuclease D [Celerinatantimonas yamalensis]|uniref:Ribonuclease D n=1 Tax=Celerinatantimonas yamalensis TaxID=559956 RepID=A0ABW9G2W4_9GAMM